MYLFSCAQLIMLAALPLICGLDTRNSSCGMIVNSRVHFRCCCCIIIIVMLIVEHHKSNVHRGAQHQHHIFKATHIMQGVPQSTCQQLVAGVVCTACYAQTAVACLQVGGYGWKDERESRCRSSCERVQQASSRAAWRAPYTVVLPQQRSKGHQLSSDGCPSWRSGESTIFCKGMEQQADQDSRIQQVG